jgi:hypothetical protein
MEIKKGILVISLDLEMRWGVLESYKSFDEYKDNILGVEKAVDSILKLFRKYNISATWAVVGAMMCKNYSDFLEYSPDKKPVYKKGILSPYILDAKIFEKEYVQFFNLNIIKNILLNPSQEIASHTYSHLFLREEGIVSEDFINDNNSFNAICKKFKINDIQTIVFPRNQVEFIKEFKKINLKIYRGNQKEWYYNVGEKKYKRKLAKIFRFYDLHFSNKDRTVIPINDKDVFNIPSSFFLRPYDNKFLVSLRIKRIKKMMDKAKKNNKIIHLWWHPHNFGVNLEKNIMMLEELLKYSQKIGLNSKSMKDCLL